MIVYIWDQGLRDYFVSGDEAILASLVAVHPALIHLNILGIGTN